MCAIMGKVFRWVEACGYVHGMRCDAGSGDVQRSALRTVPSSAARHVQRPLRGFLACIPPTLLRVVIRKYGSGAVHSGVDIGILRMRGEGGVGMRCGVR